MNYLSFFNIKGLLITLTSILCITFLCCENLYATKQDYDQFKSHLEFLSYTCTMKNEKNMYCKTSAIDPNFSLKKQSGGYLIQAFYTGSEKAKKERTAFLNFVNKCNTIAISTRYYIDKDTDLAMEVWFSGGYEKKAFANVLKQFNSDYIRIKTKYKEDFSYYLK